MRRTNGTLKQTGFSLIELVIVVVIIGIIGAIAIPRMSRGAAGAADSALVANLSVLRNAIDLYAVEHGGNYPSDTLIADQLTKRTNAAGQVAGVGEGIAEGFIFGPYLRAVPPLPVGAAQGSTGIAAAPGAGVGWIYTADPGDIAANTAAGEADDNGRAYSTY